ncbi:YegS/Rv2252/BmrU family lipid kinase [Clostridium sp. YIM B02515]|uniref:YegS/Rv2252/BmrU family lipid kinase n=1 Tax=Clostridium rhizosphaerae TaxID=2803861 RepID=A0ABS1TBP8_9CLOT|nr:YegS/Rv2252/BmrU family lipid kinase [Clostridium rhizosphaerae]MBL4936778.1 YegS/Rv2252/BmrU family lipid kinase [Clostridium rhizosphaerae]
MNKVKFIYNPFSGENSIVNDLDKIVDIHQRHGYSIVPYRISFEYELSKAFEDIDYTYKYILVAGGDGTVDNVVNHMKALNINLPIAVLPVGTANDFAKFLGIPQDVERACEQILNTQPRTVDLGKVNDKYFVNVASTGLFTDISQKTSVTLKNTMGKLAYYVKGIEQLPNFKKLKIKVSSKEIEYDGDMYLMLAFNGQTAGNLKFAYKAEVDDGYLDVIIIKAGTIKDMVALLIKMLRGEHLEEDAHNLIYFKTNKMYIECYEDIVTDIDGERGPDFPLTVECVKGGLKVLGYLND